MLNKIISFFQLGIWKEELSELSKFHSIAMKHIRIIVLAIKGFLEDNIMLRASALTYYSLLSFVPVIAMAFGVAKGFGMEEKIDKLLMDSLGAHEEVVTTLIEFSHRMLNNTKGGLIAGVGVALLFWSVIKVMGYVEKSFNAIWGIKNERSLIRKISEYLTIVLLAPIIVALASSATVFVSSAVEDVAASLGLEYLSSGVNFLLRFLPYFLMWLLLTFIYMVMPNTKVNWKSALFAGIVAGTAFEIVQWVYVNFQIGVASYNAIYGSFAAIPLFLAWLQLSWLIILFGGELSFAHQNVKQYRLQDESTKISHTYRSRLTLYTLHYLVQRFGKGEEAPSFEMIQQHTHLPFKLLQMVLTTLEDANVISVQKSDKYREMRYQPAADTDLLTIEYVLQAIEDLGFDEVIQEPRTDVYKQLKASFEGDRKRLIKSI